MSFTKLKLFSDYRSQFIYLSIITTKFVIKASSSMVSIFGVNFCVSLGVLL